MISKHTLTSISVYYVLLVACLATIPAGCEDSSQSLLGEPPLASDTSVRTQAKRVIDEALADNDPLARINAIEVVGTTGRVDLMPKVQRLLRDPAAPVRFAAALAVGDLQYAPAKGLLSPLLKDEDSNVIVAASYAMGRLGATNYYRVVVEGAENEDQTVRANAVMLLGKIGDRQYLKQIKVAQEDRLSNDRVRFQALEARARLGDDEVLKRLWALAYSAYADDRVIAVRAMGVLGTPQAKDILTTKLDDIVLEVRLVAAEQLGKLSDQTGQTQVVEVFEKKLAEGPDRQAAERANVLAALAIGQIRTPALTKYLPQLLKNESKYVRIAAAKAVFQSDRM